MMASPPKLRVFLCHASQDKAPVRELYRRLLGESWIDPWLDEENLLPGQDWDLEIEKAVEASDAVIVFLSSLSVTKEGYIQKELRKVLDLALEKPEETIFIIPLRLEECELPRRLRLLHFVDYFPPARQERAYQRLLQSLNTRLLQFHAAAPADEAASGLAASSDRGPSANAPAQKAITPSLKKHQPAVSTRNVETVGDILLMVYFAVAALESFLPSSDTNEFLLALSAILAGLGLLRSREMPAGAVFKLSSITYLLIYGLSYRITDQLPEALYVAAAAAGVSCVMLALSVRMRGLHVPYSAVSLAAFLFLVALYEIVTNVEYSAFTTIIDTLILVMSLITSVLLWRDL